MRHTSSDVSTIEAGSYRRMASWRDREAHGWSVSCFFVIVYNRSGPHLKHLIQQHVVSGTHIITDGWSGYTELSDLGYQHSVVIHKDNFVSPDDSQIHTQGIESTWGSLKRIIRARGTNKGEFFAE